MHDGDPIQKLMSDAFGINFRERDIETTTQIAKFEVLHGDKDGFSALVPTEKFGKQINILRVDK